MKLPILLVMLVLWPLLAKDPIVLQNGINGYEGFEDSYLNKHMFHTKYGDSIAIKTRYEDCSD